MARQQTETITIRVTPKEKERFIKLMQRVSAPSPRSFILDMCFNGRVIDNKELKKANRELRYQGNNLNQLTRLVHQGEIRVLNLNELIKSYKEVLRAIANGGGKWQ